jgi:thiamine transporter
MSIWWNNFIEKIAGLPSAAWGVLALIVALGVTLIIMGRKRAPKGVMIAISAVLLAALAAASYLALPIVTADLESGGVTTASWVYSPAFWAGIVCVVGIAALVMLLRKTRWSTKMLSAGALCVALSFILDCITLYKLPQGGAITPAAMLPVMFFAWTFGPLPGITAGVVHGLLGMITGAYVIHPLQFLLDYIFPFAMLGLAGLFRRDNQFSIGIIVACVARYVMHVLSGWVYFGSNAPVGQSPLAYSLIYNGTYMLPNTIICLVVAALPPIARMLKKLRGQWSLSEL